jgi:hypothetical protein
MPALETHPGGYGPALTAPRSILTLALLIVLSAVPGCGVRGSVALRSVANSGVLSPQIRTLAYFSDEPQSADIYLTDLTPSELEPGVNPGTLTGNLIHIHQFLTPNAGKTPIASTASNVTIRYIVLSRGAIGVYGGGGFLQPKGSPGDQTFGGSMKRATMKLLDANGQFHDPLGASTLSASFRAPLDPSLARLMAARVQDFVDLARAE